MFYQLNYIAMQNGKVFRSILGKPSIFFATLAALFGLATTSQAAIVAPPKVTINSAAFEKLGSAANPVIKVSGPVGIPVKVNCQSFCFVNVHGDAAAYRPVPVARDASDGPAAFTASDAWVVQDDGVTNENLQLTPAQADRLNEVAGCTAPFKLTPSVALPRIGCEDKERPNTNPTSSYRSADGYYSFTVAADATWLEDPATGRWKTERLPLTGCSNFAGVPGSIKIPGSYC